MSWNTIFGVAATFAMFLPVAAIIYYKLHNHRSLMALLVSYLIAILYNRTTEGLIPVSDSLSEQFGVLVNYLQIPLMLTALLFFCPIKQKQRTIHIITALFIAYEIVICAMFGFSTQAIIYVIGPGVLLVLIYAFYLFVKHIKMTIEFGKNAGRTLMLVSILFSYGCYGLVYYFCYIQKTPDASDALLLYSIFTLASAILMAIGLKSTRKRIRELEEVKNTRREMAMIFGH